MDFGVFSVECTPRRSTERNTRAEREDTEEENMTAHWIGWMNRSLDAFS
jgi:hypothetical protein